MRLIDIVDLQNKIESELTLSGGELTPDLEKIMDTLSVELPTKIDAYAHLIKRMESSAVFWKEKADVYLRVSKACDRFKDYLKDTVKHVTAKTGQREWSGQDSKISVSIGKTKLVVDDEQKIPPDYFHPETKMVLDKASVLNALENGVDVPGAHMEPILTLRISVSKPKELK